MPEPPRVVPRSDASNARAVVAYLWGLIYLGALREAAAVPIPFGPALIKFIRDRREAIDRTKTLIQQALRFSPGVMELMDELGWNSPASAGGETSELVAGRLSLYSCRRASLTLDLGDSALVRHVARFAVRCQLYGLVEAMTLALTDRPACDPSQLSAACRVIAEGAALAGEPDPAAAARQGYEAWCVAGLTGYLDPRTGATEEAQSELRVMVDRLDAAFGIGG